MKKLFNKTTNCRVFEEIHKKILITRPFLIFFQKEKGILDFSINSEVLVAILLQKLYLYNREIFVFYGSYGES